jgi:hypothetical protein
VEVFDESVGDGMISGCPRKVNAAKLGQGVEKLGPKLTSLVSGDCLQATETGYPTVGERSAVVGVTNMCKSMSICEKTATLISDA